MNYALSKHALKPAMLATALTFAAAAQADNGISSDEARALQQQIEQAERQLADARRQLAELGFDSRRTNEWLRGFTRNFDFGEERPIVGIVMTPQLFDHDEQGVRLAGVTPDAPADKAGLKSGDVIIEINGVELGGDNAVEKAYDALDGMEVGDEYEFVYVRDGETQTAILVAESHKPSYSFSFNSTPNLRFQGNCGDGFCFDTSNSFTFDLDELKNLGRLRDVQGFFDNWDPQEFAKQYKPYVWQLGWAWSGLELAPMNKQLGRYFGTEEGALILDSDLDDIDFRGGDVIVSINGEPVDGPRSAMRALRRLDPEEQAEAVVLRDGDETRVTVTVPAITGNSFSFGYSIGDGEDQ